MNIPNHSQFIAQILLDQGLIEQAHVEQYETYRQQNLALAQSLENYLIGEGILQESQLLEFYSRHFHFPLLHLKEASFDQTAVTLIPVKFAQKNCCIALNKEGDHLTVALRHPFLMDLIDELKTFTGLEIEPVLSSQKEIEEAIGLYYGTGAVTVDRLVREQKSTDDVIEQATTTLEDSIAADEDASMVQFVNQILVEAYEQKATDIHIEPFKKDLRIRYRVDGILREANTPQDVHRLHAAIISRLKVMAQLNISEKRRPQDGRFKIRLKDDEVDIRMSTFPTLFGEGASLRLLSQKSILLGLDKLGLSAEDFDVMKDFLQKPNGIILVTGPTGSGKSTTLYACLNEINHPEIKIVTLEDPVEYQLEGVNQIQTNSKVDLTFANGFRSILRQDPDVILVGEIRDQETAQIAMRASLTGHLILSTLHTNNALASVERLLDLDVEAYLIAQSLRAVIAQRLVRCICPECKTPYTPTADVLNIFTSKDSKTEFYQGAGCDACHHTGYQGRMALFELLTVDERLSKILGKSNAREELDRLVEQRGDKTLKEDGFEKIQKGLTTFDEVLRVIE